MIISVLITYNTHLIAFAGRQNNESSANPRFDSILSKSLFIADNQIVRRFMNQIYSADIILRNSGFINKANLYGYCTVIFDHRSIDYYMKCIEIILHTLCRFKWNTLNFHEWLDNLDLVDRLFVDTTDVLLQLVSDHSANSKLCVCPPLGMMFSLSKLDRLTYLCRTTLYVERSDHLI